CGDVDSNGDLALARIPGGRERREDAREPARPRVGARQAFPRERSRAHGRAARNCAPLHRESAHRQRLAQSLQHGSAHRKENRAPACDGALTRSRRGDTPAGARAPAFLSFDRAGGTMAEEGEKESKGFKVEDRRRFTETGEARDTSKTEERPD